MIDLQSISNMSPKGTEMISLDDGTQEVRRTSTFGLLTRRLSTTFSRSTNDENGKLLSSCEDSTRQIKMQILCKNPAIYQMFRNRLVEKCYTHLTVCNSLHHFLDNTLRIPEFREEIMNHRLVINDSPRAVGLFAYLTGDTLPLSQRKRMYIRSNSLSPQTEENAAENVVDDLSPQSEALSIPSLDMTGNSSDDESLYEAHATEFPASKLHPELSFPYL